MMDEDIKIYGALVPVQPNCEVIEGVFEDIEDKNRRLRQKYPMFDIIYNWIIVGLIVGLFISFILWGIQIHTDKTADTAVATALAAYQSEQQAVADAEEAERQAALNSKENQMKLNAKYKTKVLYGARNFEEKYGYTEADYLTLCQCMDNRADYYGMSIKEVVEQPGQWVGYYDTNPDDIDKFYKIALKSEQLKEERETRPISSDYVYAYYTDRGIYLSDEYNSEHPFTWWRYS